MQVTTIQVTALKHTQVSGKLKVSSSKKRKHKQQLIKSVIEDRMAVVCHIGMAKDSKKFARIERRLKFQAKYGNLRYAADGVTIIL